MTPRKKQVKTRQQCSLGLTLIELLVVMVMTAILAVAISFAFSAEITMQRAQETRRATVSQTDSLERTITHILEGARLSGVTADTTTYFEGLSDGGGTDLGSDRMTCTTTAPGVPQTSLTSTDDFMTQQTARGPVGGLTEVSLGMVPVGNAEGKTGLFERIQRPSDGDPTQGGTESVLDPAVVSIGFQFWDGLEWVDTWDTTTMTTRRLPQAVQVSYRLQGDQSNTAHVFVVPILASDVSPQNPVSAGGTTAATGAAG